MMMLGRISSPVLLVCALLAAGCVGEVGDGADVLGSRTPTLAPGPYESVDATLVSFDGTSIAITIHKPEGASPDHKVPVLLQFPGGGNPRCHDLDCAEVDLTPGVDQRLVWDFPLTLFAGAGFGIVSMDPRGFFDSGGESHVASPDAEVRDVMAVIDFIATLDWVFLDAPGDPRLGGLGISYGGAMQWVSALEETRLTGRTRFDAIAPEITWNDLPTALTPNGVPRSTWLALLAVMVARTLPGLASEMAKAAATGEGDFSYLARNGPRWYEGAGIRLDIPVFIVQGVPDTIVPLNHGLRNYERVLSPSSRDESVLLAHRTGHVLRARGVGIQAEGDLETRIGTCDATRFDTHRQQMVAWYRRQLLGEDLDLGAPVQLATFEGRCLTFDAPPTALTWMPAQAATPAGTPIASGAGVRVALKVAEGPLTIAGIPRLNLTATGAAADARLFVGLGIGADPLQLRVAGDQWMPVRGSAAGTFAADDFEMAGVVEDVPEGASVWLVASPLVDQFATAGSRTPGALVITEARVGLPVVEAQR